MIITQFIGDNTEHRIPLRWAGRLFEPGDDWHLIWTLKTNRDDDDASAKIQKKSAGYGITHSASNALVSILPIDTAGDPDADPVIPALALGLYVWDIQAQSMDDPTDIRTVAEGRLMIRRDVTRGTETAIVTHVAGPVLTYEDKLLTYT